MRRYAIASSFVLLAASCKGPSDTTPPQDLMDVAYLIVSPVGEEEMSSPVSLGGDSRPALVAPTPSEFRFRVRIPERPLLTFAIGIGSTGSAGVEELPGNRMRFLIRAGEPLPDQILFDREIHVARREQWIEQEVDVRAFAGREVWLVFETALAGAEDTEGPLPVVGVFAEPVLHDRARYREGRGVVLVSIDTLRRDHVSLYGYRRNTTPGLDALATESIVFDDAVSTSSWTLPAHASLLTSTWPSVHGAVDLHKALSPSWPNLAKLLQEDGFTTQAIVTHVYLSREYGFGEGFMRHQYLPETRAEGVTDRALRFLTAMGDRDFFLFVHYYDPHWHYDPPAPFDTKFDSTYEGEASGIWWDFKELDAETIDPRDLQHIKALYDGEILYTDRQVERLTRGMKQLGIFDKSLVIVTSDHGEEFLEHGHWEHQKTLYEEQLRIPLLLKLPRGEQGARRVEEQVSLLDVAPTVTDVLDLSSPATFQGRSLLDTLRGAESERIGVWAETEHTIDESHKLSLRLGSTGNKAIYTRRGGDVAIELFDLSRDPEELDALADTEIKPTFRSKLDAYLEAVAAARDGRETNPEVELDPEERERLRSLGYIQ